MDWPTVFPGFLFNGDSENIVILSGINANGGPFFAILAHRYGMFSIVMK